MAPENNSSAFYSERLANTFSMVGNIGSIATLLAFAYTLHEISQQSYVGAVGAGAATLGFGKLAKEFFRISAINTTNANDARGGTPPNS